MIARDRKTEDQSRLSQGAAPQRQISHGIRLGGIGLSPLDLGMGMEGRGDRRDPTPPREKPRASGAPVIAAIARDRRDRKSLTDDTDQAKAES